MGALFESGPPKLQPSRAVKTLHLTRTGAGRPSDYQTHLESSLNSYSVVLAYQQTPEGSQTPYLFRTYKNLHKSATKEERSFDRNHPALAHDIPIWKVARATSAAPTYFKPMKIDGLEYLDGGFGTNNPSIEIYDEVRKMNNNSDKCAKIVLSIGTGKNKKLSRFTRNGSGLPRYFNYINFARKAASESEKPHADMLRKHTHSQHKFHYVRLNVEDGLDVMKLDEWRARGRIRIMIGRSIGRLRSKRKQSRKSSEGNGSTTRISEKIAANEEFAECFDDTNDGISSCIPEWFKPRNKTLESIRKYTYSYLDDLGVKTRIAELAMILVHDRRVCAERDPERWEKVCYSAWYQ